MLTEEEVDKVRLVLASAGWNDVMQPRIENRARQALKALACNRAERAHVFAGQEFDAEDDFLRAVIRTCEWMLVSWRNELTAYEHNRRRDELDRQNQDVAASGANPY